MRQVLSERAKSELAVVDHLDRLEIERVLRKMSKEWFPALSLVLRGDRALSTPGHFARLCSGHVIYYCFLSRKDGVPHRTRLVTGVRVAKPFTWMYE